MIYELDKKISGENRERLISDPITHSIVYLKNKEVLGYYLPDFKEGPIFADSYEAGLGLMKLKYSKAEKAILPTKNLAGIEFLKHNGFTESNAKVTRMILGKEIAWNPEKTYGRMGGNFG